jgi:hypothetical protein
MPDWPAAVQFPPRTITTESLSCGWGANNGGLGSFNTAAVWPAANRAIYESFSVETTITVTGMMLNVSVQSGNLDVGIYDINAARLVSKGSTAVAVAGPQLVDITDTELTPGVYFMAMCVDNVVASFNREGNTDIQTLRTCGVQEQAVGAVTLPNPATFANPSATYLPFLSLALKTVA